MNMEKTAVISDCGKYRYELGRRWGGGEALVFIMLNPSTADANYDDPTIKRCIGFAKSHGYSAIDVVNLFAYRTAYPSELREAGYPVGSANNWHIDKAIALGGVICCAWGSNAAGLSRTTEILQLLRADKLCRPMALAFTKDGTPRHPLMLSGDCKLQSLD